jgi:hypothetical protein
VEIGPVGSIDGCFGESGHRANHLYSVAALTDSNGAVVERYKYVSDAWASRVTISRVDSRVVPVILEAMKTAISLPNDVFNDAERLSRRKHMSRSELYATAIRWYVQRESGTGITEQLNRVYRGKPKLDPLLETAALADLPQEDW